MTEAINIEMHRFRRPRSPALRLCTSNSIRARTRFEPPTTTAPSHSIRARTRIEPPGTTAPSHSIRARTRVEPPGTTAPPPESSADTIRSTNEPSSRHDHVAQHVCEPSRSGHATRAFATRVGQLWATTPATVENRRTSSRHQQSSDEPHANTAPRTTTQHASHTPDSRRPRRPPLTCEHVPTTAPTSSHGHGDFPITNNSHRRRTFDLNLRAHPHGPAPTSSHGLGDLQNTYDRHRRRTPHPRPPQNGTIRRNREWPTTPKTGGFRQSEF